MYFLVNSNQWEGSAPLAIVRDRNHGFSTGTIFKRGEEAEMTGRGIFHWPVAESVRGLLKNSASLFAKREPEKRQWDLD